LNPFSRSSEQITQIIQGLSGKVMLYNGFQRNLEPYCNTIPLSGG